jgi:uncharacterized membrane protein
LVVHFPIAFLFGATLLYYVAALIDNQSLTWAALWMLLLGAIGAAVSSATGLYANEGAMVAPSVRDALLNHHKHLMIGVTVLTAIFTVWAVAARPMPRRARWAFLVGLAAICLLIARGADYGGRMVYDYNAGGDACGQPIDFSK